MGGLSGNITRTLCGAIACIVSVSLLTCAFVNVAYAVTANTSLPNTDSDINGGSYNPTGYLFGTDGNVFTDTWYSDESIFFQTLSGTFQLVQDKSAIYTAVVADLVRQGNNLTAKTNYWLSSISNKFSTLLDDTGNILFDLRFSSYSVNGTTTKTIRGLVKDISDAMVANNASLQQIKDAFYSSDGYNYLSNIKSNTDYLYTINNALTSTANGTIRDLIGDIESNTAGTSTVLSTILSELRSNGYIGQKLSSINNNLDSIYGELNKIRLFMQYGYHTIGGSNTYSWLYTAWTNRMTQINNHLANIENSLGSSGSIVTKLQSIADNLQTYLSSTGYIGQQLDTLNNKFERVISAYENSAGSNVYYLRVMPLSNQDNSDSMWVNEIRSSLSRIETALGSEGYIGRQLKAIYDEINRIRLFMQFGYHTIGGTTTNSWLYTAWTNRMTQIDTHFTNIENALSSSGSIITTLNGIKDDLSSGLSSNGYIGTQLKAIYDEINRIRLFMQFGYHTIGGTTTNSWLYTAWSTRFNQLDTTLTTISDELNKIRLFMQYGYHTLSGEVTSSWLYRTWSTLQNSVNNVYDELNTIRLFMQYGYHTKGDNPVYSVFYTLFNTANGYLQTIAGKTGADLTNVETWLDSIAANNEAYHEELMGKLSKIILLLSVPDDDPFGDFDEDLFKTKTDELIDNISQLAPFGAILVASMELSLLTQVDPITKPELTFPFDFGGFGQMVTLDFSWLDDAKPLFNFFTEFLFILALLTITMKYVRQEATS